MMRRNYEIGQLYIIRRGPYRKRYCKVLNIGYGIPDNNIKWWGRGYGNYTPPLSRTDPDYLNCYSRINGYHHKVVRIVQIEVFLRHGDQGLENEHNEVVNDDVSASPRTKTIAGVPALELMVIGAIDKRRIYNIDDFKCYNGPLHPKIKMRKKYTRRSAKGDVIFQFNKMLRSMYSFENLLCNKLVQEVVFLFFDLEATGLEISCDVPTEVAFVARIWDRTQQKWITEKEPIQDHNNSYYVKNESKQVDNNKKTEFSSFQRLIKSDISHIQSQFVTKFTGIDQEMLNSDGVEWDEMLNDLQKWILKLRYYNKNGDGVTKDVGDLGQERPILLVGHSAYTFDLPLWTSMQVYHALNEDNLWKHTSKGVKIRVDQPKFNFFFKDMGVVGVIDTFYMAKNIKFVIEDKEGVNNINIDQRDYSEENQIGHQFYEHVGFRSLSLKSLHESLCTNETENEERNQHRALDDCYTLKELFSSYCFRSCLEDRNAPIVQLIDDYLPSITRD